LVLAREIATADACPQSKQILYPSANRLSE